MMHQQSRPLKSAAQEILLVPSSARLGKSGAIGSDGTLIYVHHLTAGLNGTTGQKPASASDLRICIGSVFLADHEPLHAGLTRLPSCEGRGWSLPAERLDQIATDQTS
jgi:hypothetical protein